MNTSEYKYFSRSVARPEPTGWLPLSKSEEQFEKGWEALQEAKSLLNLIQRTGAKKLWE